VPHGDAVVAPRAGDGTLARREDDAVALLDGDGVPARLRPRPLLDEEKLAARIRAARRQRDDDLQWKRDLAVDVLMEAVVAAGRVLEEERRRPPLPRRVTTAEERAELCREGSVRLLHGPFTHSLLP